MKKLPYISALFLAICLCVSMASCYSNTNPATTLMNDSTIVDTTELSLQQKDSALFFSKHHYTEGYNFIVYSDSISLLQQQPEELVSQLEIDTFSVGEGHQVVVGEIRIIPQDSIDSVWVQLATDEGTIGWIHEQDMLRGVVPVDPISQFIMFFSDSHIIIAVVVIALIICISIVRFLYKRNVEIMHLRNISTFYSTFLCLSVATAATGYASLQMFAPETWQHYFFNPTLNPLHMPLFLGIFIASVWVMLIVLIATIDETLHRLSFNDAAFYLLGLCGLCSALYIIFSVTTLYYVGYPLLVAYFYYALKSYFSQRNLYICGNCGCHFREKGRCPRCGIINE